MMPPIIYGTAWKKDRTRALVEQAIKQGFRGVDTACQPKHYHEPGVGEGLAACMNGELSRADIYVQTKFTSLAGQDPKRVPYDRRAGLAEQVAQSFEASLRNLRTSYIDCLVMHSPEDEFEQTMEVWRAMEALVDGGGVKQLGISNCYSLEALDALYGSANVKPVVLQNRFYDKTDYDREIRAFCRQHEIHYQSFWTLTANRHVLEHEKLETLASRYGRTPAQVLFRYLTQIGVVPLTGTTSEKHMREDLAIFEFELTERERDSLTALF
jgi:diketogulonate reductase-like aldo/keto reductase